MKKNFLKTLVLFIALFISASFLNSCSKSEILQTAELPNETEGKNITVNMNLNTGFVLNKTTRASADFQADIPTSYTAYFFAAEDNGIYKTGDLVKSVPVNLNDNQLSIPDIKYDIYVTNYVPDGFSPKTEQEVKDDISSMPDASKTLYLEKESDGVSFDSNKNLTVTLENLYAAVCIYHNSYVASVNYNNAPKTAYGDQAYKEKDGWFYMYIKTPTINSTVYLANAGSLSSYQYTLDDPIKPNYIYEYTVSINEKMNFTVHVDPFAGIISKPIVIEGN